MFCIYCGKEIEKTSQFCQYCGMRITPSPALGTSKQHRITSALIGLALSVIGVAITCMALDVGSFLGIPASIAAVILCSLKLKNTHAKSIVITGLCLGAIGIILGVAIITCHIASPYFG